MFLVAGENPRPPPLNDRPGLGMGFNKTIQKNTILLLRLWIHFLQEPGVQPPGTMTAPDDSPSAESRAWIRVFEDPNLIQ